MCSCPSALRSAILCRRRACSFQLYCLQIRRPVPSAPQPVVLRNGGLGNSWCTTPWPVAQGARPAFRRAACQKRAPVPQRRTWGWARPVKKPPLPPCLWKRFLVSDGQTSNLVIRSAHVLEQTSCKALHGMCSQQSAFRSYAQLRGCEAMCRMTAVHADDRLNDHPKHTRHRACSAAALKELCFFDAKYPACSAKR